MQREKSNKNLSTAKPTVSNFAGVKRIDPDRVLAPPPTAPLPPQPADQPTAKAKVARGRCVHVPGSEKRVVGSRAYDVGGTIVYRDITAAECRAAGPGEIVELPTAEIERLMNFGFLTALDDAAPNGGMKVKQRRPETGIVDDVRLSGVNNLTTATGK